MAFRSETPAQAPRSPTGLGRVFGRGPSLSRVVAFYTFGTVIGAFLLMTCGSVPARGGCAHAFSPHSLATRGLISGAILGLGMAHRVVPPAITGAWVGAVLSLALGPFNMCDGTFLIIPPLATLLGASTGWLAGPCARWAVHQRV